ncbi:mechanosensitive ion channel family protein [Acidobacteriota bacterium]
MCELIQDWLVAKGLSIDIAGSLARSIAIASVIVLSILAHLLIKRLILKGLRSLILHTATKWDDALLERRVLSRLSHIAPALVIWVMVPLALEGYDRTVFVITRATLIYMLFVGLLVVDAFLNAVLDIYRTFDVSRQTPIKGFVQSVKLVVAIITVFIIISIILNKTPFYLLSGLGALTAVLMLIFKDAILGFVAGIQLTANKMVTRGDWIAMPKYDADGTVTEVALTTVKVQNWDKTITTIPTHALISESFRNWRGMQVSGGRRIKRAIYIDMNTIKFCSEAMLKRFSKINYISEYIDSKKKELEEYNVEHRFDYTSLSKGRHLTNIGTFRAYLIAYLKDHPMINKEMTFLVRQLHPTENGLPIEIYVFCKDTAWVAYEAVQADIMDHILAIAPEFFLRIFQNPTGSDFQYLSRHHEKTYSQGLMEPAE